MEPQKPETLEERMLLVEVEMKRLGEEFTTFNEAMCSDLSDVRQEGVKTREMVVQANGLIVQMPDKIIKAIDDRNKTKRMELKDWALAAMVLAGLVSPWLIPLVYKASH